MNEQTIRDVSQTLLDLLDNNLSDAFTVALLSPKNPGSNRLTLFLYKVLESPEFKNAPPQTLRKPDDGGKLIETRPPLTLDLYYLLTAHSGTAPLDTAHIALSQAMRIFHDNGVLQGSLLRADDETKGLTKDSVLRLTLNPLSMEDMSRIWSVFPDTPYEISVAYLVTPVQIPSTTTEETVPVLDQFHEHGQREAEIARSTI